MNVSSPAKKEKTSYKNHIEGSVIVNNKVALTTGATIQGNKNIGLKNFIAFNFVVIIMAEI